MTTVNSKSDIKEALKRGETEFYTTNKTLLYASALVAKFKSNSKYYSSSDKKDVKDKIDDKEDIEEISPNENNKKFPRPWGAVKTDALGKVTSGFIVATSTGVAITAMVLITAIGLYALFKDYDIEIDFKEGKIKCKRKDATASLPTT